MPKGTNQTRIHKHDTYKAHRNIHKKVASICDIDILLNATWNRETRFRANRPLLQSCSMNPIDSWRHHTAWIQEYYIISGTWHIAWYVAWMYQYSREQVLARSQNYIQIQAGPELRKSRPAKDNPACIWRMLLQTKLLKADTFLELQHGFLMI